MTQLRNDWCPLGAPVAFVVHRSHAPELVQTLISEGRAGLAIDVSLRQAFQRTETHYLAAEPQFCYEEERGGSLRFGHTTRWRQTFT